MEVNCVVSIKANYSGKDRIKGRTILLFGGGGGWVILKKNILHTYLYQKKFLAHDHWQKNKSYTFRKLKIKFLHVSAHRSAKNQ